MFWYNYLNNKKEKNLLSEHTVKDDEFVVCWQRKIRKFTIFDDYISFIKFNKECNIIDRCFYEVLLPGKSRKIYFDIDLEKNKIDENDLIINIKKAIFQLINNEVTILVFTSHTDDKFSFHIILPNCHLLDENAASNFYDKTIELIPEKYHPYIDKSVYKNVQQFRLLGSHKYGKANIKVFNPDLSENFNIPERYVKPEAKFNYLFRLSLISNISESTLLSKFSIKEEKPRLQIIGTANEGDIEDVLDIFYANKDFSYDDFMHLNTIENNGNLIITFRRQNATYCSTCERIHENENPYIVVKGIERDIYFYCRRKEGKGIKLGSLGQYKLPEIDISEIPVIEEIVTEEKLEFFQPEEDLVNKVLTKTKRYKPKVNFAGLNLKMYDN